MLGFTHNLIIAPDSVRHAIIRAVVDSMTHQELVEWLLGKYRDYTSNLYR